MTTDLYNLENKSVGAVELPDKIFGAKWKPDLVHQIIEAMRANIRQPWAHAKGRGEVRGGGKKPWRQKGTGRARHGSIRSPIWSGGGVSHGPIKERSYAKKINKKMRRAALFSALSKKFSDHELQVIDALHIAEPKTKIAANFVSHFRDKKKPVSLLIIPKAGEKNIYRAARNLKKIKTLDPASLNVYDIVRHKIILIDQRALSSISEHFCK
ncbi:MAG: 50S ribosomal protein L4 [bacterium]|nr:50S ribosomal protein L4 [bacterium]